MIAKLSSFPSWCGALLSYRFSPYFHIFSFLSEVDHSRQMPLQRRCMIQRFHVSCKQTSRYIYQQIVEIRLILALQSPPNCADYRCESRMTYREKYVRELIYFYLVIKVVFVDSVLKIIYQLGHFLQKQRCH